MAIYDNAKAEILEKSFKIKILSFLKENAISKPCFNTLAFVFAILFTLQLSAQSNEGKSFWFGFMEHRDIGTNTKVAMITSKYNTSGIVNIPFQNWSQPFTVSANNVTIITLPAFTEVLGSETIDDVGVQVSSNQPVSVYIHQYHDYRSEATVVLPNSSLDKEYYIMTYTGLTQQGQIYPSEFLIVGTENETTISITVSDETYAGKVAGTNFSIQLNAGETYQVQARYGSGDLTGSHILADKKISVFGGNRWTEVPSGCNARDNLLEQMYPVNTWGKKFVTIPNDKVSYDIYRILAAEDNTNIEVTGATTESYSLNAGQFVEYSKSEATFIIATKPIQVAQFLVGSECNGHSLGDPSMVLLNSVEQTRDTVTLYNSSFENISENFINIVAATTDFPFITFDGQAIPPNATIGAVGQNNEFTFARVQVGSGAHTIISEACGVIATAYGYGTVESYAYSGGASFKSINNNPIPEGGCLNDTIYFDTKLSPARYSFFWDLGDGSTSTKAVFSHFYPNLGTYPVELIIFDECLETSDTLTRDLLISLRQAVEATGDTLICEGESFSLSATDITSARFEWIGPNGYFSESQFPVVFNAKPQMSGEYAVIGIVSGCATFPSYANVEIIPTPTPNLGNDTIFCSENIGVTLEPGNYSNYLWQDNSVNSTFSVQEEGTFWVEVVDEYGCIGSDTVNLKEICPTKIYVPNAFSPNFDGTNDYFGIYGFYIIKMNLTVFDRWGGLVFETSNPDDQWDGSFKGEPVSVGVYTWQLEVEGYEEDGTIFFEIQSGSVTLIR